MYMAQLIPPEEEEEEEEEGFPIRHCYRYY